MLPHLWVARLAIAYRMILCGLAFTCIYIHYTRSGMQDSYRPLMCAGVLPVRQVGAHAQAGPRQPDADSHGP